ncbi:ectD [Symbiodinium sp. CCMP2592]|nr:ectD [Symbiodinium sp. CCMP2592]
MHSHASAGGPGAAQEEDHFVLCARSEDLNSLDAAGQQAHASMSPSDGHRGQITRSKSRSVGHAPSLDAEKWTRQLWEKKHSSASEGPSSGRKPSSTPNIKEMDAAFLLAVEAPVHDSIGSDSNGRGALSSAEELPALSGAIPPSRRQVMPEPPTSLPGKLNEADEEDQDSDEHVPPRRDGTGTTSARLGLNLPVSPSMHQLSKQSHTHILDNFILELGAKPESLEDVGCRIASAFPRSLYFVMILLPLLAHVGTDFAVSHFSPGVDTLHERTIGYSFFAGAVVVYCCGATLGMHLLRTALRSGELSMAIEKLHGFIQNSEEWSEVSRRLRRQHFLGWLISVISFVATLEEWKLRSGVIQPPPISETSAAFRLLGQLIFTMSFILASAVIFLAARHGGLGLHLEP